MSSADNNLTTEEEVPAIQTICRDCFFAEWNLNVQTGCKLNRIRKLSKYSPVIHTTKDSVTYYTIHALCNTCRTHKWAAKQEEPYTAVFAEVKVTADYIILITCPDDLYLRLSNTLNNIPDGITNPHIISSADLNYIELNTWLKRNHPSCKLTRVFKQCSLRDLMDEACKRATKLYVIFIESGDYFPFDFLNDLDQKINYDCEKVSLIRAVAGEVSGLTVQRLLYKYAGGNKFGNVEDKIIQFAKGHNKEHLIL